MKPVSVIIIGAGSRGSSFSEYIQRHPEEARLVGVAEPRPFYRQRVVGLHQVPADKTAEDWRALADKPKFADAMIIATPDREHAAPAEAFAARGYAILLEKPMATTAADCRRIVAAAKQAGVLFAVFHDFRYMSYTRRLKEIIA